MEVITQVKADVPLALKRRTFSQLALRGQYFNCWLKDQMERWLAEVEATPQTPGVFHDLEVGDDSER